jgi:hypothetical protein
MTLRKACFKTLNHLFYFKVLTVQIDVCKFNRGKAVSNFLSQQYVAVENK